MSEKREDRRIPKQPVDMYFHNMRYIGGEKVAVNIDIFVEGRVEWIEIDARLNLFQLQNLARSIHKIGDDLERKIADFNATVRGKP